MAGDPLRGIDCSSEVNHQQLLACLPDYFGGQAFYFVRIPPGLGGLGDLTFEGIPRVPCRRFVFYLPMRQGLSPAYPWHLFF